MNTSRKDPVSVLAETNTNQQCGEPESATRDSEPRAQSTAGLCKQAEEKDAQSPEETDALSPAETQLMLYELRVHQIQLEMQNEELRRVQAELDAARARYFDLYDLAPVGYFTVGEKGLILESNLTAATLLGVNRAALVRQPLTRFILKEDQDLYYLLRKRLSEGSGAQAPSLQTCELRMVKPDGSFFWAQLDATATEGPDGAPACRVVLSDSTERRKSEEALQESDLRFRHLLQSVPNVAVQGYGPDGTTLYWNDASERLYGYTAQEALGRNLVDLIIPPEMRDVVTQLIQQMAETGQQIPAAEMSLVRKDGSRVSVFSSHATFQIPGQPLALFCIDIDITERKRAEEAQRETSLRLQESVRAANVGLWDWDLATHCVHYSSEWKRQIGYADAEIGDAFEEWEGRVHPEDLAPTLEKVREAITGDSRRYQAEFRFRHKDGSYRWIVAQCSVLRAENGKAVRVVGSHIDLTEFRRVEEALHESETRFRSYIEHSPYGVFVVDGQGRYVDVNPAAVRITGYSAGQITSMCISDLLPPESHEVGLQHFQTLLETGESIGDTAFRHADGSVRHWRVSATRLGPDRYLAFVEDITERKDREAHMALLVRMLDEAPAAITIHDTSGRFLFSNRQNILLHGCVSEEEFMSVNLHDLDTPESEELLAERFQQIAERGAARFEVTHRRKDGSTFPLDVMAKVIDWRGRQAVLSIALDITVRKQAEEKIHALLRESENSRRALLGILEEQKRAEENLHKIAEQFRTLAEVAPVGIYLCDPSGNCLYANPAWCGMAGLSATEALGKGWAAGLHPEDRDRIFASWEHMVESHGQWGLEYRFCTREGKVTWVYGLAAPQYDATGKVAQYVGINLDITERKREDDVLAFLAQSSSGGTKEPFFSALARYLAQLLDMDFVCIDRLEGDGLNARTVAVWHDGRFEDNVTYALKDTPCGDVVGKQVCCFPSSVCQLFPRDQVLKDLRAESYIGVTLFGHTGKPVGLIAVIGRGPLTNRPLAEAVLKLVAVRASAEIERQDSEAELQKIDKLQSVGTLAGGIAHDFNNVLLGLFGNISIAMDDLPKDHPSYEPLEEAEKSMTRAVRLTKQLLTFAKGGDPVKEHVSLGAMTEEVARFDLTGSNVSLVYHHDADLWPVDADRGQLQQVISNLVINARQAMPSGGHLHVTLENADLPDEAIPGLRAGRYVKGIVQDEGGGIEPKVINRIFDPYFTTKQTGSGLGLATVWSIINKHGGNIGVESEVSKGATFTFYLPASSSRLSAEEESPSAEIPSPVSPAKILVMDDEEMVCDLASKMLTRCGYTVTTAPNGQETLALYRHALDAGAPFDLVIMDLTIPGGPGGKEVIQDLLKLDPNVRALVSSGYAADPVMASPAKDGFKGTVAKPYTAKALREAVARTLA